MRDAYASFGIAALIFAYEVIFMTSNGYSVTLHFKTFRLDMFSETVIFISLNGYKK
jgi:hypothetical protein